MDQMNQNKNSSNQSGKQTQQNAPRDPQRAVDPDAQRSNDKNKSGFDTTKKPADKDARRGSSESIDADIDSDEMEDSSTSKQDKSKHDQQRRSA